MNGIFEKEISSKNIDNDGAAYKLEWSSTNNENKHPVRLNGKKEEVIHGDQQESQNKIDQRIKTAIFIERFTLVVIVVLSFGLLIQQGTICVSK